MRSGMPSTRRRPCTRSSQAPSSTRCCSATCTATPISRKSRSSRSAELTDLSPRGLDRGDVDLLHRHHRIEGASCFGAPRRERIGERAGCDLPGQAPAVLAPSALALLAAIADDRVPVAIGLFLCVRRDLEGKRLVVLEGGAAVETEARNARDREVHCENIALL